MITNRKWMFCLCLIWGAQAIAQSGCPGTGSVSFQFFSGIPGNQVSNLTSHSTYPNSPSFTTSLTSFEIPANAGNNYGSRVIGYLCPPATGTYYFWIAADHSAELWLGTSQLPASRQKIAYLSQPSNPREWNKFSTQKSVGISLTAGQLYFIEALHKEQTQNDHLAVGWSLPGQNTNNPSAVITGQYLVPFGFGADNIPPSVPANVSTSFVTSNSFRITWSAATDNIAVTGYNVFLNNTKVNSTPVTTLSYNASGLTAYTQYQVQVQALDAAGNASALSPAVQVTTADEIPPTVPTGLQATSITNNSFTLTWQPATDNAGMQGYHIFINDIRVTNSPQPLTQYQALQLTAGTTYKAAVVAVDIFGNQSAQSQPVFVTTTGGADVTPPSAPGNLTLGSITSQSFTATWQASTDNVGVTGYDLFVNGIQANTTPITGTSFTVQQLQPSTRYFVFVRAFDAAGNFSPFSNPADATTLSAIDVQPPSVPTNLAASQLSTIGFLLSWNASTDDNSGVAGYHVYLNGNKVTTTLLTATQYLFNNLAASTSYQVQVQAVDNQENASALSPALTVTTLTPPDVTPPSIPNGLVSSDIYQTGFTVSWNASTDNVGVTGYNVYVNGTQNNTSLITGLSYELTDLNATTAYSITVRARDAAGNESNASTPLSVTTLGATVAGTENFNQRTVIASQSNPYDLAWGPNGTIWFTERRVGTTNSTGRVAFVNVSTGAKTTVLTLGPTGFVSTAGQDGLMGLALHPDFANNPWVYIAYTYANATVSGGNGRLTRIARYTYNSSTQTLGNAVTILENIPGSNDHNSGRLSIGPDNKLYYTVGDMGAGQFENQNRTNNAQNLNILEGKVLRLNLEPIAGSWIPTDNPFTNNGNATAVYTYGHRNAQGLVWANVGGTNRLYSSEHGPFSDDEINLIERSRNYGWPQVIGYCDGNYNGRTTGGFTIANEVANCNTLQARKPLQSMFPATTPGDPSSNNSTWPSIAPSGMDYYGSSAIPGWQNSLLVANLKAGYVSRFKLNSDGTKIISNNIRYFSGQNRYRDIIVSADGTKFYVACDNTTTTSGPGGGAVTSPGAILEFSYQVPAPAPPAMPLQQTEQVVEASKQVSVYPNPANSEVRIYAAPSLQVASITLMNQAAQPVANKAFAGGTTTLQTQNLPAGVYWIQMFNKQGKRVHLQKLIIQH